MKEPSPAEVALRGVCPRCGNRTLFAGLATFAPRCRACSLDFADFNVGDGPAAFLILIVGGLIVGLAIALQPPDESRARLGQRVDPIEFGEEAGNLRITGRRYQPSDIDLRQLPARLHPISRRGPVRPSRPRHRW